MSTETNEKIVRILDELDDILGRRGGLSIWSIGRAKLLSNELRTLLNIKNVGTEPIKTTSAEDAGAKPAKAPGTLVKGFTVVTDYH